VHVSVSVSVYINILADMARTCASKCVCTHAHACVGGGGGGGGGRWYVSDSGWVSPR